MITAMKTGLFATIVLFAPVLFAQDYEWDAADVEQRRQAFIDRIAGNHGLTAPALEEILAGASIRQSALNAISRPAERVVPWYEYREIFMNQDRIEAGAAFWRQHRELIEQTASEHEVDPETIVAVIGIETLYGERMGTYRVIDALSTLAFAYPPRADFFASELESFLIMYTEEGESLLEMLGSYAGAMGAGQFIPSSYRAYAIDANDDGRRDLWSDWEDILGSVANYLAVHGWQYGEPIAFRANLGSAEGMEPGNRLGLDTTVATLRDEGYSFDADVAGEEPAMLVAVEHDAGATAYFVGLTNFHVITRYNRSVKYALAVLELGEAIEREYRLLDRGEGQYEIE